MLVGGLWPDTPSAAGSYGIGIFAGGREQAAGQAGTSFVAQLLRGTGEWFFA